MHANILPDLIRLARLGDYAVAALETACGIYNRAGNEHDVSVRRGKKSAVNWSTD